MPRPVGPHRHTQTTQPSITDAKQTTTMTARCARSRCTGDTRLRPPTAKLRCVSHQLVACDAGDDGNVSARLSQRRHGHVCLPAAHLQRLAGQLRCLLRAVAKVHHVLARVREDLLGKAQEVPAAAGAKFSMRLCTGVTGELQ
jgi:hypothetical protein